MYVRVNHDTVLTTNGNIYETIAVIPEGYRPVANVMCVAIDTYSSQPLRMDIYRADGYGLQAGAYYLL